MEAERGPIADYPYLALEQQLQATGLALAPVLERVVQLDRDPLRHDVDEPLIIGLHPGWDRCCGEIPTPSKVGMLPRNSLSNVLMPDSTASSLGPHYVTHIVRTQCCGPSLQNGCHSNRPATARSCTRAAVGSVSDPKAEKPYEPAKRFCVSPAQGFGHPTSGCHRPNGRRKETASRLTHPQDKQRTRAAERPFLLFINTRT